jgi:hypothetical protein
VPVPVIHVPRQQQNRHLLVNDQSDEILHRPTARNAQGFSYGIIAQTTQPAKWTVEMKISCMHQTHVTPHNADEETRFGSC